MMLSIIKITDGKAGHVAISDGVIESISKIAHVEVINLDIKIRTKFFLRILKFILKYDLLSSKFVSSDIFMRLFYKNYHSFNNQKIDLIVSAGGDTIFINIWLSRILNAKNIFCGTTRGISSRYFDLIVSVTDIDAPNSIKLDSFPIKNSAENMKEKTKKFCKEKKINEDGKFFVLLIGGNGGGYSYTENDYQILVHSFMSIVKQNKAKALITTSRRTGLRYEKLLEKLLSNYSKDIAYSVYFGQNPEKVVVPYLGLGSIIFVTEESGSMISESLFAKKPVFLLYPGAVKENKRYKIFVNDLCAKKRVARISINKELSNLDLDKFEFNFIDKLPTDELVEKIKLFMKDIAQ
ncbi:MAG: ELM1/GtrOC1 family putative glycosyltransferase [Sulfurovaceae bacterium]